VKEGFFFPVDGDLGFVFLGGGLMVGVRLRLGQRGIGLRLRRLLLLFFVLGFGHDFAPSGGFEKFILMGKMMLLANGSRQCVTAVKDWLRRQNWVGAPAVGSN
jgi:hypothetical protein